MSPALGLIEQVSDVHHLSPGQTPQGTGWLSHVHHPQGVKPTNETPERGPSPAFCSVKNSALTTC